MAPKAVHHATGAIRYCLYGFFTKLAIWFVAPCRGHTTALSRDNDFTDYGALKNSVFDFVKGGCRSTGPRSREATDG